MIQQYPHYLFVKVVTDSVQDEDGSWSEASELWVLHSVCREQTNGKGSLINGSDGKAIVFASTVHMPLEAERIQEGSEVLVSESESAEGLIRVTGTVLKFDEGQLHCRLWV
jgi:hypothetical protein